MKDNSFVHSTSLVDKNARVGANTRIWQFCNIMNNVVIGNNCNIGQNVFIESGVIIGNNVKIKNNISIYTGVVCEDDVFLGPSCVFTNVLNPRSFIERKSEFKQTIVKKGASIGANATIICGNKIGRYAMIGAGTVVTKNVPDYALVIGNPGKIVGYVCKCGERLTMSKRKIYCDKCEAKYLLNENNVLDEML
ncbi:acyltransferase [Sedimentibacter sp.]|uniref:acyltransferase n=1 Tax=Sedimentibacter sp. TaxID=1960295 RepID=UPI0028B24E6A|nr:acyltransferase [Sedimentibacter sp.]